MAPRAFGRAGAIIRSIIEGRGVFGARLRERDRQFASDVAPLREEDLALAAETGPSAAEIRRAALLFALTVASTWATGGAAYAASILTILSCHEAGHYVMCRRYRVPASLPIFIPMPLSPFGTMGAIIRMSGRVSNRRTLYDIGIAGPLAGIGPALAAVAWGLAHSNVVSKVEPAGPYVTLGDSLIFHAAQLVFFPHLLASEDVLLHPVAFAGWAGLFVTALNLLPIGQLDGGHVLYGLFGARSWRLSLVALVCLAGLAVYYPGWWTLVVLLLIFGVRHPRTLDETSPLGTVRVALGIFALLFFVVSFIPQPFLLP
jgi:membrane-associated protease RseP (regulator of RpoE activity)